MKKNNNNDNKKEEVNGYLFIFFHFFPCSKYMDQTSGICWRSHLVVFKITFNLNKIISFSFSLLSSCLNGFYETCKKHTLRNMQKTCETWKRKYQRHCRDHNENIGLKPKVACSEHTWQRSCMINQKYCWSLKLIPCQRDSWKQPFIFRLVLSQELKTLFYYQNPCCLQLFWK